MGLVFDINVIISFSTAIAIIFIVSKLFNIGFVRIFVKNAFFGIVLLYICKFALAFFGINIIINPITAFITGLSGVFGVVFIVFCAIVFGL